MDYKILKKDKLDKIISNSSVEKGSTVIDIQENLTMSEVENKINWFIDNGYYQMADYKAEIIQGE